jgi:hypothetical protein
LHWNVKTIVAIYKNKWNNEKHNSKDPGETIRKVSATLGGALPSVTGCDVSHSFSFVSTVSGNVTASSKSSMPLEKTKGIPTNQKIIVFLNYTDFIIT